MDRSNCVEVHGGARSERTRFRLCRSVVLQFSDTQFPHILNLTQANSACAPPPAFARASGRRFPSGWNPGTSRTARPPQSFGVLYERGPSRTSRFQPCALDAPTAQHRENPSWFDGCHFGCQPPRRCGFGARFSPAIAQPHTPRAALAHRATSASRNHRAAVGSARHEWISAPRRTTGNEVTVCQGFTAPWESAGESGWRGTRCGSCDPEGRCGPSSAVSGSTTCS